jgi:hypothetical protein
MQPHSIPETPPLQRESVSVWDHSVAFSFSERLATRAVERHTSSIADLLGDEHCLVPIQAHSPANIENGFCPFIFRWNSKTKKHAATAQLLVLDYDRLTADQTEALFAKLDQLQLAYVAHTTKNHMRSKEACRHPRSEPCERNGQPMKCSVFEHYRVVLPLDRPVSPADYVATFDVLVAELPAEAIVDPMSKVCTQRFTFPCCPDTPGGRAHAGFKSRDGYLLQAVKAPILQLVPATGGESYTVEKLRAKLAHAHSKNPEVRTATQALLKGEALPFEQGRKQLLWLKTLTSVASIASSDGDLSPEVLELLVTPSVEAGIFAGSHVTRKGVRYQIERALETVRSTPRTFIAEPQKSLPTYKRGALAESRIFRFLKEEVDLLPAGSMMMSGADFYSAYVDWAKANGGACSNVTFAKVVRAYGIARHESHSHSSRYAVRLKGQQIHVTTGLSGIQ